MPGQHLCTRRRERPTEIGPQRQRDADNVYKAVNLIVTDVFEPLGGAGGELVRDFWKNLMIGTQENKEANKRSHC
jgi:hypothetical protein